MAVAHELDEKLMGCVDGNMATAMQAVLDSGIDATTVLPGSA